MIIISIHKGYDPEEVVGSGISRESVGGANRNMRNFNEYIR